MSHYLTKQTIDKQQLSVFTRDLAKHVSVNLKHIIEDTCQDILKSNNKGKKHNHKSKKKPVIKKKDLIIMEQNKKREENNYQDDTRRMDFVLNRALKSKDYGHYLQLFKTKKGETEYQLRLLEELWKTKQKSMEMVILLYFHLQEICPDHTLIKTIGKKLDSQPLKEYMLKSMGTYLPPLNVWGKPLHKLDDWQKTVIQLVQQKKNVIVKAPTSSGKSFIAMAAGILHKKILYVCPAKPVAYQVGAHFIHMGYKVHFLVENLSHYSYDSKTNIFIGTPYEIESQLPRIGTTFDYAVFDEIHNLNSVKDGDVYENIIKIVQCPFLALSATIQNSHFLQDCFQKIHPKQKIEFIEYTKRFMNQQRWFWNGSKLETLHPLAAFPSLPETFEATSLKMTPGDCSSLWDILEDVFDEKEDLIDGCSPDEYFIENKLLTLDDCSQYESFLKQRIVELQTKEPQLIQEVFDNFQVKIPQTKPGLHDVHKLLIDCKKKSLFPMLMFHTDEEVCQTLFYQFCEHLETKELDEFPYHYDILEMKEDLYQAFSERQKTYETNLTIGKQCTNSSVEKAKKVEQFIQKEKEQYTFQMLQYYEQKLNDIQKSEHPLKEKQYSNLSKEMNEFLLHPDFCSQDIYQKHKQFVFTPSNEPMSAETIRGVRREIRKTLGIKIPYESPLFQMLKRGIGIYIESMPDEYNWIIQKLLSDKLISVVITDKTLCLGIDLPVRTSCFLGMSEPKFTTEDYLQMSGRAGRRGKDTQGNIIFFGDLNVYQLMDGQLPILEGSSKPLYSHYQVSKYQSVKEHFVNQERSLIQTGYQNESFNPLLWNLRSYKQGYQAYSKFSLSLESELFQLTPNDRLYSLIENIQDWFQLPCVDCFKRKKIQSESEKKECQVIVQCLLELHNGLHPKKQSIQRGVIKELFDVFNRMSFSYLM